MSLLAIAALATAATSPVPPHSVSIEHRGGTYNVDYRATVRTFSKTIGTAPPTRTSSQRCVLTAEVSVERVIADGGHALTARLPEQQTFTRHYPGDCTGRKDDLSRLVAARSGTIAAHVARLAAKDRAQALAAIDAAHHFAAN